MTDSLGDDLDSPLLLGGAMFTAVDHRRRASVNNTRTHVSRAVTQTLNCDACHACHTCHALSRRHRTVTRVTRCHADIEL